MHIRHKRSRPTRLDAALALLAPLVALLTFPFRLWRPKNPLYYYLGAFIPRYEWESLPTSCMGMPSGPAELVRTELLLDLAGDLFVFTLAIAGVCVLALALTGVSLARAGHPPRLALVTFFTTVLSVLAWAEFYGRGLALQ
jgi:hypothetical protein